jgi:hypothetical protein
MQEARSQREERFTRENMEGKKVGGGSGRYYSRSAAYYTS